MIGFRVMLAAAGRGLSQAAAVTWDPAKKHTDIVLSNNDLTATHSAGNVDRKVLATSGKASGKWYLELVVDAINNTTIGFQNSDGGYSSQLGLGSNDQWGLKSTQAYFYNSYIGTLGPAWAAGNIIGFAVDMDTGKFFMSVNNTWHNSADPSAGTGAINGANSDLLTGTVYPAMSTYGGGQVTARFKSADFTYTPPSGFSEWES